MKFKLIVSIITLGFLLNHQVGMAANQSTNHEDDQFKLSILSRKTLVWRGIGGLVMMGAGFACAKSIPHVLEERGEEIGTLAAATTMAAGMQFAVENFLHAWDYQKYIGGQIRESIRSAVNTEILRSQGVEPSRWTTTLGAEVYASVAMSQPFLANRTKNDDASEARLRRLQATSKGRG